MICPQFTLLDSFLIFSLLRVQWKYHDGYDYEICDAGKFGTLKWCHFSSVGSEYQFLLPLTYQIAIFIYKIATCHQKGWHEKLREITIEYCILGNHCYVCPGNVWGMFTRQKYVANFGKIIKCYHIEGSVTCTMTFCLTYALEACDLCFRHTWTIVDLSHTTTTQHHDPIK